MNEASCAEQVDRKADLLGEGLRLPDFVIAGVTKCGTTSLFQWLRQHPQVCASTIKETRFLNDQIREPINIHEHGLEGYGRLFKPRPGEKLLMEATPVYYGQRKPLEILPRLASRPRLLFLVREPAARLYSRFKFEKYVLAWVDQGTELADWLGSGLGIQCLEQGHYVNYLRVWRDAVGGDRVRVMLFEDLVRQPESQLRDLSRWLGLDESFWTGFHFKPRNPSVNPRSRTLHLIAQKTLRWLPSWLYNAGAPIYFRLNAGAIPAMTTREAAILDRLREQYMRSNDLLAEDFGLDLTAWAPQ